MKRVLSLIVALTMLMAVMPAALAATGETGYADVDGTNYETPVAILRSLNIMSGYTDGNFHPYNTITRAEMAVICVRMRGIFDYGDDASIEEVQYKDMDGHWAAAAVAYARSLGIVDGNEDGNFYPDESITYEQAIKMVVATLGYDYYCEINGGYPSGYLSMAQKLKITSGVGLTMGAYITRGDVAKIVYNSLTVNIMEEDIYAGTGTEVTYQVTDGNNILNTYFDVEKVRGLVVENDRTSLTGESTLKEGQVRIGDSSGEIFNTGSTGIADYIGYYVTLYALDDDRSDNRTVISFKIESGKNDYIKIDASNIENVTLSNSKYVFEYWRTSSDKTTRSVKTSTTPLVIYNGVALLDYTVSDLAPEYGQITLVDNDNDGKYDIVDVLDYDIMLVMNSSETSGNITSVYSTGTRSFKADESDDDYTVRIIDGNGNKVPFSNIVKNSVVSVAMSRDEGQTVRTVIVSNDSVTGSIESITEDGLYTINGKDYDSVSYVAEQYELSLGDNGTFFLTHDGKIAGFDGEAKLSKNIGLFISYNNGGLAGGGEKIKIMKTDGSFGIYSLASKVKLNGETLSGKAVFALISDETSPLFGKHSDSSKADKIIADPSKAGILFRLNKEGKVSEIVTATATHGTLAAENAELNVESRSASENSFYYSTKYRAFHISDKRSYVTDNTVIFTSSDNYTKTDDSQIYGIRQASSCYNNEDFYWYTCYFYYIDNKMYADFAVFYDNYDTESSSSWNTDMSRYCMYDKIKVVDRVVEFVNSDGDINYRLVYWEGGQSKTSDFHEDSKTLMYRDGVSTFWRRGDMVNFCTTSNKITAITSIFYDNTWNDAKPGEEDGEKIKDKRYLVNPGKTELWANSSYHDYRLVQRYLVGRVTEIDTMKYFSVFDLNIGSSSDNLTEEPIEGECYRFNYDSKGYIIGVENVGNGALAENQLVLVRKNGNSGTIGCRVAESYILYEPEDFTQEQKDLYSSIYSDYYENLEADTEEVTVEDVYIENAVTEDAYDEDAEKSAIVVSDEIL